MTRLLVRIVLLCLSCAPMIAQNGDKLRDRIEVKAASTSIVHEGLRPWHLKMAFTIYDENGINPTAGTLEQWWAAPGVVRTIISTPGESITRPAANGNSELPPTRMSFVVGRLEEAMTQPLREAAMGSRYSLSTRFIGKAKMECVEEQSKDISPDNHDAASQYCFDADDKLRAILTGVGGGEVLRSGVGRFQNREVATDVSLLWGGKRIIQGKVESLDTFDLATLKQRFTTASSYEESDAVAQRKFTVMDEPEFLDAHLPNGTVVLGARVSATGTVENLFLISSSDFTMTAPVLHAASLWQFKPAQSGGKAVPFNVIWYFSNAVAATL